MDTPQAEFPPGTSQLADETAPPLRMLLLVLLAVAAGGGLAVWLESGHQRPIHAHLAVRTTFVTASRPGRAVRFLVQEGESVTIGQELLELADRELERELDLAQQLVESRELELRQAEARSKLELASRQDALDQSICQLKLEHSEFLKQEHGHKLQQSMLADLLASHDTAMWDNGDLMLKDLIISQKWPNNQRMATVLQMEAASFEAEIAAAQVRTCQERIESLQSYRQQLPEQIREMCGVELAEARLAQARRQLDQLSMQQSSLRLTSPAVGQVGMFRIRPGDELRAGDPIVELLDDEQRYLVAEVPSQRITEFAVGKEVALIFPGGEQRTGRVVHVAPQALPRDPSRPGADPFVQVEIEQSGRLWPQIPTGSRVEVLKKDGK